MTKISSNKLSATIIFVLLSFLLISQVPGAFSQQTSASPATPATLPTPGSTYQAYWNGSAWAKLSNQQQVTPSYQGVTNITVPDLLPQMITNMNITYPNPTELNNALSFFSNVIGIDLTHYNVQLMPIGAGPAVNDNGVNKATTSESYILYSKNGVNATDGTINIMCMLEGTTIYYLDISRSSSETPFYSQPIASSVQDQAGQFLSRYANYSSDTTIANLQNLMKTSTLIGTSMSAVGDSTLQVKNVNDTQNSPYVTLIRAPEGINNTYDTIVLSYQNGMINQFIDFWNRYPIGSFDVNFAQAEALQVAKYAAQNYSFTYNGITESNFTLSTASDAVICDLQMQPRNGTLYPLYGFSLGLSRTFPGGITELQVGVWADTGQVAGINYVSSYGALTTGSTTNQPTNSPSSADSNTQNKAQSTNTYVAIAAVAVIVILATTISVVVQKKRKH